MPIEGSCGLELMLLLFPEFHRDVVLADPSDLTYDVTHSGPLFLVYPCMSLDVASHTLAPGDTSALPALSLTRSFSQGVNGPLLPLLADSLSSKAV